MHTVKKLLEIGSRQRERVWLAAPDRGMNGDTGYSIRDTARSVTVNCYEPVTPSRRNAYKMKFEKSSSPSILCYIPTVDKS